MNILLIIPDFQIFPGQITFWENLERKSRPGQTILDLCYIELQSTSAYFHFAKKEGFYRFSSCGYERFGFRIPLVLPINFT